MLATLASTQATPPRRGAGAGAELRQGPCMEGWTDGSAVGLGCLLADLEAWGDVETTGETACRHHGEGGRLVEVLDGDQMSFLQEMLGQMEADNQDTRPVNHISRKFAPTVFREDAFNKENALVGAFSEYGTNIAKYG